MTKIIAENNGSVEFLVNDSKIELRKIDQNQKNFYSLNSSMNSLDGKISSLHRQFLQSSKIGR